MSYSTAFGSYGVCGSINIGYTRHSAQHFCRDAGLNLSTAQKLREVISSISGSLGSTPAGQSWCLKALHPSDAMVQCYGLPDENSMSTVMMNYQTVQEITVPGGTGDGWSLDLQVVPHPVVLARHSTRNAAGALVSSASVPTYNTQLAGATHSGKYDTLTDVAAGWRLAYFGVTVILDAPALSNQGTIVVCQKPVQCSLFNPAAPGGVGATTCGRHMAIYNSSLVPSFSSSQAMPNAYFASAKEGAYVPLRLTRTSQRWVSAADAVIAQNDYDLGPWGNDIEDSPSFQLPTLAAAPPDLTGDAVSSSMFPGLQRPFLSSVTNYIAGGVTSPLLNDYVADICLKGLSQAATVKCFFRVGLELMVLPASTLSAQLKVSPGYDPEAIVRYFQVSRMLKDAYPEEYNSLDKLWNVIRDAARVIGPSLSMIPRFGPMMSTAAGVIAGLPAAKSAETASAVEKEARQAVVASGLAGGAGRQVVYQPIRVPKKRKPAPKVGAKRK